MKYPIAIMSFDRPSYLELVLQSVKSSKGAFLSEKHVFLFQDGAVNAISGRVKACSEDIERSIEVFRRYFPDGNIRQADNNLGVALNFERAENELFTKNQYEGAIFL